MLPRAAIENRLTAAFEAVDLAAEGRIADGYQVLLLGRQKALGGEASFERVPSGRRQTSSKGDGTRQSNATQRATASGERDRALTNCLSPSPQQLPRTCIFYAQKYSKALDRTITFQDFRLSRGRTSCSCAACRFTSWTTS